MCRGAEGKETHKTCVVGKKGYILILLGEEDWELEWKFDWKWNWKWSEGRKTGYPETGYPRKGLERVREISSRGFEGFREGLRISSRLIERV